MYCMHKKGIYIYIYIVCGRSLVLISTGPGWFMVFVVLCPGDPKAQPAVVLILKSLRRRGHGLKSHPTDWESREFNCVLISINKQNNQNMYILCAQTENKRYIVSGLYEQTKRSKIYGSPMYIQTKTQRYLACYLFCRQKPTNFYGFFPV